MEGNEPSPMDLRLDITDLDDVDFRTVTWSFPSSPISASVWRSSRPSKDTTSESTLKETMEAAVSGNCSMISIFAPRYSKRNKSNVYHIIHCKTTTCTIKFPEKFPYIAFSNGIPITSVLGNVDTEKIVIIHSGLPLLVKLVHSPSTTSIISFCSVSAAMNLKFMVYGSLEEMKWKESNGTANMATNRLIPEH
jgi:hypothetical protein